MLSNIGEHPRRLLGNLCASLGLLEFVFSPQTTMAWPLLGGSQSQAPLDKGEGVSIRERTSAAALSMRMHGDGSCLQSTSDAYEG